MPKLNTNTTITSLDSTALSSYPSGSIFTTASTSAQYSIFTSSIYELSHKTHYDYIAIKERVLKTLSTLPQTKGIGITTQIIQNKYTVTASILNHVVEEYLYVLYVMLQYKKHHNETSINYVTDHFFVITETNSGITLNLNDDCETYRWYKYFNKLLKRMHISDVLKLANGGSIYLASGFKNNYIATTGVSSGMTATNNTDFHINDLYQYNVSEYHYQSEEAVRAFKVCTAWSKQFDHMRNNYGEWKKHLFAYLIIKQKPTCLDSLLNLMREFKSIIRNGLYGSYRKGLLNSQDVMVLIFSNFVSVSHWYKIELGNFNPFKYSLHEYEKIHKLVLAQRDIFFNKYTVTEGGIRQIGQLPGGTIATSVITPVMKTGQSKPKLKKLIDWKVGVDNAIGISPSEYIPLSNLLHVFGNADVITQFCNTHELTLHDAGQFVVNFDYKIKPSWIHIFMESRGLLKFISRVPEIEQYLGGVPKTVTECKEAISGIIGGSEMYEMYELGMDDFRIKHYSLYVQNTPTKTYECIPAPGGLNGIVAGDYVIRQLAFDDTRQLFAGEYTGCCQHLFGAASSCAKASYEQPTAAVWGVFKHGRMIAQSFVWRSGDILVLDSIEYVKCNHETVALLYVLAARSVINHLGIEAVTFGWEYNTVEELIVERSKPGMCHEINTPDPEFKLDYTDTKDTVVVIASTKEFELSHRNLNSDEVVIKRLQEIEERFGN